MAEEEASLNQQWGSNQEEKPLEEMKGWDNIPVR
jgi:hypothetical protein